MKALLIVLVAMIFLPATLSANTLYFPQVPYGGGYTTTFVIMNTGAVSINSKLDLYDQAGVLQSTQPIVLPVGGSQRIVISGTGAVINVVYGILNAGLGFANGVATFDLRTSTNTLQTTAGILGVSSGNSFLLPVDQTASGSAGVAIANTEASIAVTVSLRLYNEDGTLFASASDVRLTPLGGHHQIADFVTSMFPQLIGTTFKGTLAVQAVTGAPVNSLAVAALTVKEGMLSAISVVPYTLY